MKRLANRVLSLATAVLMIVLLVMTIGAQAPDKVGATIKVPDDYATIQAAIDAAEEGDTIQVIAQTFEENLLITKDVTLSGGWSVDFTVRDPGTSIIDGLGLGRVISITTASSDTVVTIDGFTIRNGDASDLGIPEAAIHEDEPPTMDRAGEAAPRTADRRSPSVQAAELRQQLSALEKQGPYPGGEQALEDMLEHLAWRTQQAEEAKARAETSPMQQQGLNQDHPGAGGGIYSWNASPHLLNNIVEGNIATQSGLGYGGGIFIGQAADSSVVVDNNVLQFNSASLAGEGRGGGLHVQQAPGAKISGNRIAVNVASDGFGFGGGGGVYVYQSPGAILEDNILLENIAMNSGVFEAVGGGLMVYDSQDILVRDNLVQRNTANAAWESTSGAGGGMFLTAVDGAKVTGNRLYENLTAIFEGGGGGGLKLQFTEDALVEDNELIGNWGGLLAESIGNLVGGGMSMTTVYGITVQNNEISGNIAGVMIGDQGTFGFGGGLYGDKLLGEIRIINNNIHANIACHTNQSGVGLGGGLAIGEGKDVEVVENNIEDNVGCLIECRGSAGGLHMRDASDSKVLRNRIQGNIGGFASGSSTGGMTWDSGLGEDKSTNVTVDGNLILDNQASVDLVDKAPIGGVELRRLFGDVQFTNNVVAGNQATEIGGVSVIDMNDGAVLVNNTIADNDNIGLTIGQGFFKSTTATVINNIVANQTVGINVDEGTTATVSYTLWDGNDTEITGSGSYTETHPVTGDPSFVDPASDDYHLSFGSAAIDAGDPAGVPPAPDHDADGVARPRFTAVDIGAYEWLGFQGYLPLIMNRWHPPIGWAVGDPADGFCTILKTTDGGDTWQRQGGPGELPDTECGSVSAIDADNAWVVSNISILRTRDGGLTWETQVLPDSLPQDTELEWIKALDGNTAWAVGFPDVLLQTTDGHTWSIMPRGEDLQFDTPVQYSDVDAVDSTHVWAVGSHGPDHLKVRDETVIAFFDGVQWHRQGAGAIPVGGGNALIGVSVVDEDNVWAVGGADMPLAKTTDGGVNWQQVGPALNPFDTNRVVAVTADSGWVTADSGGLLRTDDGGKTWEKAVSGTGDYLYGITAMDTRTAWAVGIPIPPFKTGHLLRTKDGQNWEARLSPVEASLSGISFVGARR